MPDQGRTPGAGRGGPLFAFSGGSWFRRGMGVDLYRAEPAFRASVDACCAAAVLEGAPEIAASFRGEPHDREWTKVHELLAIAVLQIAQTDMWAAHGVSPGAVIGVSGGEITGAYAAGMLTREEVLGIMRPILRFSVDPGEPAWVFGITASSDEAKAIVRRAPCPLWFVGSFEPRSSMVVTLAADTEAARDYLRGSAVITKELAADAPYHTPRTPELRQRLVRELPAIPLRGPSIPRYVASAGRAVDDPLDATSCEWLVTRPFHLDEAALAAFADGWRTVITIGPSARMGSWLRTTSRHAGVRIGVVTTMEDEGSELHAWRSALRAMRRRRALGGLQPPRRPPAAEHPPGRRLSAYAAVRAALRSPLEFSSSASDRMGSSLTSLDPPGHDRPRAAVGRILSAARTAPLEASCDELARDLLRPHVSAPELDVLAVLATPLSEQILGRALRLEGPDLERFAELARGPLGEASRENVGTAVDTVPPDLGDLTGDLDRDEVRSLLRLAWLAGTVTTRRGFAPAVLVLGRSESWRQRLLTSPSSVGPFVEEILRLHPPEPEVPRRTDGGDVWLSLATANRDPEQFPDPDVIDLDRPLRHLAFGTGPHRCPGARLARAEIRACVGALLELIPRFELVAPLGALRYRGFEKTGLEELLIRPQPRS